MTSSPKKPTDIKIWHIINWLLSSNQEIPQEFLDNRVKIANLIPYITEQLWVIPRLVKFLNQHVNDLYNIPDAIQQLKLLKKIFKYRNITKQDLWNFIPKRTNDPIKAIEELDIYDENNARSKFLMMTCLNLDFDKYLKPAATKKNLKKLNTVEAQKIVSQAVHTIHEKETEQLASINGSYIKELTQEIIDKEGLILFDITILKKTNRVLFTFIDKNNQKKYYLENFHAKFYISKQNGVINNDYIENLAADKFQGYMIKDIGLFTRLKYLLNDSYKRILNASDQ